MKHELFSVIILCYRHFEYLPSAIDSVLAQDYPNIELIVSDDGSPNFPKEELEAYIAQHKGDNITQVTIRQQPQNGGTVRHLNSAIQACSGAYIISLSGDDNLYNERVLSSYVEGFRNAPENCCIEMAHSGMYDEDLKVLTSYYLKPDVQQAIEATKTDSAPLMEALIRLGACLPSTSTCFKKEFFQRFGAFDERYTLVEDFPMHIRLAKEGWIIHYANFVAIKHRHGGISHGQSDTLSRSQVLYFEDSRNMIENLTLQNLQAVSPKEGKKVSFRKKRERDWINFQLAKSEKKPLKMLRLAARHPAYSLSTVLQRLFWPATRVQKPLLGAALFLGLFGPVISAMLQTVTLGRWYLPPIFFLTTTFILSLLWLVCKMIVWLQMLLWKLQTFPKESLTIG